MKQFLLPLGLCLALAACHSDTQVELKADAYCAAIVQALQTGHRAEAERQVKALNDYARTLSDDSLQLFMLRYETHVQEIAAAASQTIQGAIEQARDKISDDNEAPTTVISVNPQ